MVNLRRGVQFIPIAINLALAIVIGAISIQLFFTPANIAPTGVTGLSVILNELVDTPIGLMVFVLNIPIMLIGYCYLNGMRVVIITLIAIIGYSIALDNIGPYLPEGGLSDNVLLNALFGGVTGGIGTGFVLRAGGTYGSSSMLALIIQRRTGTPMSTTFLYVDFIVITLAGLVFGWEAALYATVALFLSGVATDYVLEGPSVIRVVFIITEFPVAVSKVILEDLDRGVTAMNAKGMYTDSERAFLMITISRSEVNQLRDLVSTVDENAFIVVGQGHTAYGAGFKRLVNHHQKAEAKLDITGKTQGK